VEHIKLDKNCPNLTQSDSEAIKPMLRNSMSITTHKQLVRGASLVRATALGQAQNRGHIFCLFRKERKIWVPIGMVSELFSLHLQSVSKVSKVRLSMLIFTAVSDSAVTWVRVSQDH